jgi:hypothetical protein
VLYYLGVKLVKGKTENEGDDNRALRRILGPKWEEVP